MKEKTVLETIYNHYDHIFSAERKVADYVIHNPAETVECNVAELAEKSGVSDATVVRMCKHIGYKGYYQFRIMLAKEIQVDDKRSNGMMLEIGSVQKVFKAFAEWMQGIGDNIDQEAMIKCVRLIDNCGWAHLIAVGNTSPLAQYMGFRLGRLGVQCTFSSGVEYFMNQINLAAEQDIVIAISRSGSSRGVISGIRLAKEKGLKVIVITEHFRSEAAQMSDYVLLSNADKNKFEYTKNHAHLNEIAVIDALLTLLSNQDKIDELQSERPEIIISDLMT